jgi:hypothetical protein
MIIRGMPAIFINLFYILYVIDYYEDTSYVIFFSDFIFISVWLWVLYCCYDPSLLWFAEVNESNAVGLKISSCSFNNIAPVACGNFFLVISNIRNYVEKNKGCFAGKRNYSTLKVSGDPKNKSSKRKNLSSPESRPYEDLYAGRGIPNNEPIWVKDNGKERSPFKASWAKDEKDRLHFPSNYPCNYINISDPFNNRKLIKETCKGNRVVYIWTYLPTGVCLVGSSSNSVERVISYFEKKYLFLDTRRGVQFLADY